MTVAAKARWRLKRLAHMGWPELRFRVRQAVGNRWDYVRYRCGAQPNGQEGTLLRKSRAEGLFFFSHAELPQLVESIRRHLPDSATRTVEQAERILAHRFDLLGFSGLDFGEPINWHFDPVHKKRSPLKPWYRVPFLDFSVVGDSKVIWEINRHQHWVTLGKAYRLTGDEKYAREFVSQFHDWQRQNPYPMGVNWASALEVGMRSISWLWSRELFADSAEMTEGLQHELLTGVAKNAHFLERNLSIYFSPNTHLIGEAVALFFIGVLCPQLRGSSRWRALGWELVRQAAAQQVRKDGSYFEQSVYYHVYALDFFLHARILAARNQIPVPPEYDQTLQSMLEYLAALCAGGVPPRLGDDDGGRLFDPSRNRAENLQDPLTTGALLYHRGDFLGTAHELAEETVWLLGSGSPDEFHALRASAKPISSRSFEASGTYVLSSADLAMTVDAGPLGSGRGGHGHADALSLCVAQRGQEWLRDCGTFTYTGSEEMRNRFRGTSAHNTVTVDGKDQVEPQGPFAWDRLDYARVERWTKGETFDFLQASHSGYLRLPSRVTHRRSVFFLKHLLCLVLDEVEGSDVHEIEINWHTAADHIELKAPGTALLSAQAGQFGVIGLMTNAWSEEVFDSWYSPVYGVKRPARSLRFSAVTKLPAEFPTLLVPGLSEDVQVHKSENGLVRAYHYTCGEQHSWFFAKGTTDWALGRFASDADVAYVGRSADGKVSQVVLCNGQKLTVDGTEIAKAERRVERLEVVFRDGTVQVFCSEPITVNTNFTATAGQWTSPLVSLNRT